MGAKILAVDDEEGILRLLKRALERDGAEVDTVSDPMRIMTGEVNPDRYDLILLDVMMPGIDGFTLLNGMRDRIDCPVLFLTAKTSEEDLMRGFGLGADDYNGDESAVTEHVKNIRAKFRKLGLAPVETVWGIGYRWTAGEEKGNGR